jgi:hypothetical protein
VSAAPKAAGDGQPAKTERSAAGLREVLFAAIDDLRSGAIDDKKARSIATLSQQIIGSIEAQVAYEKLRLDSKVPGTLPEMALVPKLTATTAVPNERGR